jgi:hypothetical protein
LKVDNLGGGEYRVNFDCTERENIKVKAEVKNEFGTDSCECQVNVRRTVKIVNKLKDLEVKEGEDATLKVKVDCYPKPSKVKWFIDGVEISGKKYETSDSGDEYALKIKSIERKTDSNKLDVQVKVENELGQDECSASVTIKCSFIVICMFLCYPVCDINDKIITIKRLEFVLKTVECNSSFIGCPNDVCSPQD